MLFPNFVFIGVAPDLDLLSQIPFIELIRTEHHESL